MSKDELIKNNHSLSDLKQDFFAIQPPERLEKRISKTISWEIIKRRTKQYASVFSLCFVLFVGGLNLNESFAMAMNDVPIIGAIVRVLSFNFATLDTGNITANVETPVITGLTNEALEETLNAKYYDESKALYEEFIKEVGDPSSFEGHMGFDTGFVVKTDTEELLSIGRYYVNTAGSSSTTFEYDTIDKKEGLVITLPSLFKDQTYIEVISNYLIEEMQRQMKEDEGKIYWVGDSEIEPFERIEENQDFYISAEHKLVLSFDKYTIAPGYMGIIEFIIPTELISELLVSDKYIR
ncbi:MAG: hypothetical protein BGO41_08010 [Clostridiales bacterium 38-18]|nr:MAG: hypothetical protein BGO41_08010 [Clostridiales bacterium 38-18]